MLFGGRKRIETELVIEASDEHGEAERVEARVLEIVREWRQNAALLVRDLRHLLLIIADCRMSDCISYSHNVTVVIDVDYFSCAAFAVLAEKTSATAALHAGFRAQLSALAAKKQMIWNASSLFIVRVMPLACI